MTLAQRTARRFGVAVFPLLLSGCVVATERRLTNSSAELVVDAGASVPIVIDGQRHSMTIDPGIGASRLLNQSTANALNLKGGGIQGVYRIGPVELIARSTAVSSSLGGTTGKLRFHWFDREVDRGSAGLISPALLPYATVTMRLRPTQLNERLDGIAFRGASSFGFSGGAGIIPWQDKEIRVGLDPARRATLVSASLGAILSTQYGGRFEGQEQIIPIRYGISRPVRLLRLARPFQFAGLRFENVLVRGSGGASNQESADSDPTEEQVVVVVGSKGKPRLTMTIGSDDLRHCSFVRFNNAAAKLEFSCQTFVQEDRKP